MRREKGIGRVEEEEEGKEREREKDGNHVRVDVSPSMVSW
jgi:hypothetical protein